ncbi:MAG: [protein-PII] uridylyltransferase [bacterium]|nr:[protein-PII] uridylyltransferase [bacterium]
MAAASKLPPAVIQSRERLLEGKLKLKAQHDSGSPGLQVCARLADLVDSVVMELAEAASASVGISGWEAGNSSDRGSEDTVPRLALVAHGGYGRRDVAPYSDVDLMLLHAPAAAEQAGRFAKLLSQWIVDAGCQLGFSLRTPQQAWKYAWDDAIIFTSLAESRLLAGDAELYGQFWRGLKHGARRRRKKIVQSVEQARKLERSKYGETVFLLEPNIKRSRGGLRDVQLIRWVGLAAWGETDLEQLTQLGHITQEDYQTLRKGYQYLLRLRNQMHFDAGKPHDQLDRSLQMRLAEWSGFRGEKGILPVEQFMREYFAHTSEIRYSSAHFMANAKWQSPAARTLEHVLGFTVHRDYRVGFRHIWATRTGLERLKRDPAAVMELMALSSRYGKPIDHNTWREIRDAMRARKMSQIDQETIHQFLDLMAQSSILAGRLRRLHELRVLEQVIPAMAHARCLLQFNQYHKYTVDAHCIRAVECVTELETETSLLGTIYRSVPDKTILHLALLLHDLGKGFPEDHSEVGKRIAEETADRLRLSAQDKETLVFLVHQHLLLTHTAFRFDLSDDQAAIKFASVVGSSERLQLLLLLSYADLASVGPGVVNQWKIDLLLQLYYQTDAHFRDMKPGEGFRAEVERRRELIIDAKPRDIEIDWWRRQVTALPINYLLHTPASVAAAEVANLKNLDSEFCTARGRYIAEQKAVEYTIATRQSGRPIGTFHRITGALTSQGMQIIAADIHTQPDEIAWDRFLVEDEQHQGPPPATRIQAICNKLQAALDPENPSPPVFPKKWRRRESKELADLQIQPTQVRFDNSTSDKHTIITLFAYDRRGLLYSVSKALYDMALVLHSAKISTHLDQVVDVFYVSDLSGKKIQESTRLYMIRQRLLRAVGDPLN